MTYSYPVRFFGEDGRTGFYQKRLEKWWEDGKWWGYWDWVPADFSRETCW